MTARAAFKQADVERACKAMLAVGLPVGGVEFNDNGFVVIVGEAQTKRKNKADELYGPAS